MKLRWLWITLFPCTIGLAADWPPTLDLKNMTTKTLDARAEWDYPDNSPAEWAYPVA
jgi:hypothetical protein